MRSKLQSLAVAIESIERRAPAPGIPGSGNAHEHPSFLPTGWPDVDEALGGGLPRGAVHEWFGEGGVDSGGGGIGGVGGDWFAPLSIFIRLGWRALEHDREEAERNVVWIGRRCWPHPRALIRHDDRTLLKRSLLIDPPDEAMRLWAIDLALRSPAVAMVIADGSGFGMPETRRLQLAAEGNGQSAAGSAGASGGASGRTSGGAALLARPPHERAKLSAAMTRWRVRPALTPDHKPRWTVELLRCKGVRPVVVAAGSRNSGGGGWAVEWNDEQSVVHQLADVVRGFAAPPPPAFSVPREFAARKSA